MYKIQAIFGLIAKSLSSILMVISIPISIIFFAGGICMWQIDQLLITIYGEEGAQDIMNNFISDASSNNIFEVVKYVGVSIFSVTLILFIIFLVAIVIKVTLYKSVSGFLVARNKELRNIEINKAEEKLDKYRYRE